MSKYVTDKRYPGVRKRFLGFVEGFGDDRMFSLNCRDKKESRNFCCNNMMYDFRLKLSGKKAKQL